MSMTLVAIASLGFFSFYSDDNNDNQGDGTSLEVPKNVRSAVADGKVTVTWDAVNGATSYKVFRSADGQSFSQVGFSLSNSFTDNSPLSGLNYYRIQALGANDVQSEMSAMTLPIAYSDASGDESGDDPDYNGHTYVDLGLPSGIKWATCNIGASSPSDYGYYYAWGETTRKAAYTTSNSVTYGKSMGNISGNPEYDAARANWGGSWRLPSLSECVELNNQCTWTWTNQGGHNGCRVTGPNGNSIFLPAAGCRDGSSLEDAGDIGFYSISTPYESNTQDAYGLFFNSSRGGNGLGRGTRSLGLPVRPVSK